MLIVKFQGKTRRGFQKLCALLELDMVEIMASYFAPVRIALYICPVFNKKNNCVTVWHLSKIAQSRGGIQRLAWTLSPTQGTQHPAPTLHRSSSITFRRYHIRTTSVLTVHPSKSFCYITHIKQSVWYSLPNIALPIAKQ